MSDPTRQEMADLVIYLIGARRHIDGHTPPVKFKLEDFSFSSSRGDNEKEATLKKLLGWLEEDDEIKDKIDYRAVKEFNFENDYFTVFTTTERLLAYLKKRITGSGSIFNLKNNDCHQMVIGFAGKPTLQEISGIHLQIFTSLLKKVGRPISHKEIFNQIRSAEIIPNEKITEYEKDNKEGLRFINERIDHLRNKLDVSSDKIFSENNLSIIDNLKTTHESTESGWYRLNY